MQNPKFASHVHEVIHHGLDLFERLDHAARVGRVDELNFTVEQGKLRTLLRPEGEVARNPEFSGTPPDFFGARYALACWLDELFNAETCAWADLWAESTMEDCVVGDGQHRAQRFWRQAVLAASPARTGTDALEVYLWCFALGFQGIPDATDVRDTHAWADQTRLDLIEARNKRFPHEDGIPLQRPATVLSGRREFGRMASLLAVSAAFAALAAMYQLLKLN